MPNAQIPMRRQGVFMPDEMVVLVTASSEEEAARIARVLVDDRLAACVNILPGIRSIYFWDNKVQDERESLMICKTRQPLFEKVMKRVKELHSYTVPEIIALPIAAGSAEYLRWVQETTKE